ncbi:MAG: hypothetical protein NC548_12955 [Lachnospiraceae bacterium]|nr:hypothetical protein [Lachnospiraceae bacterium]MCM1230700.1 hypothetical protein [Ruminococcus flavefaciens]
MESNESRQINPLQDLFLGISRILDFMEVKDLEEARNYETTESADEAAMWVMANLGKDSYTTYKHYWKPYMFRDIISNVKDSQIEYWMKHPYNVPVNFRENLLKKGRQAFLDQYVEKNEYYRMLNGLPPLDTPESEFVYLTEPTRNQLHASTEPVHLLSPLIQNSYITTDEYKQILKENPDKKYLKYLGMYKIDIFTARSAKDFEIIRYPSNRSDINPNLIKLFASTYNDYREYVMVTLYNPQLEDLYVNYRTFMRLMIQCMTLLQISNKSLEALNSKNYLTDAVIHIFLSMHDIPNDLLMTNEVRRSLAINMLKLVREKGTDDVYYDLVDVLGYQDIVVSKLMLMKGQKFDEENNYSATGEVEPYFLQLNLQDKNPYDTITKGQASKYSYHDIIDGDPRWWDLPDTREILKNRDYSIADSKYIMVEAVIHQIKYLFESIYFTRMVLDNKDTTDEFKIEIPEIFGTETVSIYDLMVFILCATCMNNNMSGEIVSESDKLLATAGFNFDMDLDSFEEYLETTKYVDKERIRGFMENLTMTSESDINRLFNDVMYPMREYLELKIARAENRKEYVEYESIYRALFTYDATRNNFLQDFEIPLETIRKKYDLSEEEMRMYKHFYPRKITGERITVEEYPESRYTSPFLAKGNEIDWWIHIVLDTPYGLDDRGYVYFHDILNCADIRELTNPNGTRVFMDYEDGEIGWQINQQAVDEAIRQINRLDEDMMKKACFQIDTPILNSDGSYYSLGEYLSPKIRSGIFKDILKEKIQMDVAGLAVPPKTYQEYLYRKNKKLYDLLIDGDRFHLNKQAWLDDVMRVVLMVESELNLHMKYFEQSVVGSELFFKPLITLIKHFKSTMVDFAKSGLSYIFGDKIDSGGNSNMFKLFDEVRFIVHFVTLASNGYESQFGIYDTEHKMKYHILMKDRSEILRMISDGFAVNQRTARMGSIHFVDEMKFFLNGNPLDPIGSNSHWISGEPGTGRWEMEDDIITAIRKGSARVQSQPVDLEAWKDYVESYTPIE